MPSFRSADAQAKKATAKLNAFGTPRHTNKKSGRIHSVGSSNAYQQSLKQFAKWLIKHGSLNGVHKATSKQADAYLLYRANQVQQKTLNRDIRAIEILLSTKLQRVTSNVPQSGLSLQSRVYSRDQIALIQQAQSEANAFSTQVAWEAGLRASELLSLRRSDEASASHHRKWHSRRFSGLDGVVYIVKGKGGLIREVMLSQETASRLEVHRLPAPIEVHDRGIKHHKYYDIRGGQSWSQSFRAASKRTLGWSKGGHSLRHTYAQRRILQLSARFSFSTAKQIVSQELGHFRKDIIHAYLR